MEMPNQKNHLPCSIPEEILEKFRRENCCTATPEEKLELAMILSGKCFLGGYMFLAPTLGTYLLLEEWESPFLLQEKERKRDICMQDFFLALFILENGKKASEELLKYRSRQVYESKKNGKIVFFPYEILEKTRRKYCRLDPVKAAMELQLLLSIHTAFDMLPGNESVMEEGQETFHTIDEKSSTEKICDLLFLLKDLLVSSSFEAILWKIPSVLAGYLIVQEYRARGIKGIGKMQTSAKLLK